MIAHFSLDDMKISILAAQIPISLSIQHNLTAIIGMLDHAQSGDVVIFPEGAVSGYAHDLSFRERIDLEELSVALDELRNQAQKRKIYLWVGSLILEMV